jgi:hypothetical protein
VPSTAPSTAISRGRNAREGPLPSSHSVTTTRSAELYRSSPVPRLVDSVGSSSVAWLAHTDESANMGAVAHMAHIGGFFTGFLLTFLFGGADTPNRTM